MSLSKLKPSLHSYRGLWDPHSSTSATFYDKGDGSARLHLYNEPDKNPLLWDTTKEFTVPFAIPFQGNIRIQVWVALEESAPDGMQLWLTNDSDKVYYCNGTVWSNDRKLAGFSVWIGKQSERSQTPWCFNESLSWTVFSHQDMSDEEPVSGSAAIEAYGIYESQPQFFLDEGIPIDLLRLFIPTTLSFPHTINSLNTEQDWINWVTNVCHGKQDPKGTPGQLRPDSTQHWLRYNVWDGAYSFIDENGGPFSLMGWLNSYKIHQQDPTKSLRLVNCFDQAAIVETVLGLGLSYNRLHWEIVGKFGYIDEDLTGWGSTNSPFFEGDTQNKRFSNVADPMRTPFRSHVFITISPTETYIQSESMVVDACAGPVAGDLTYTQYLTTKALQNGIELLVEGHTPPKEPWMGVQSTNGTSDGWTLNYKLESLHPDTLVHMPTVLSELSAGFAPTPIVAANFNAQTIINTVLQPILSNTGTGIVLKPQSDVLTIVNDSTIVSGASTTRLSVAGKVVGAGPTFISFQISAFSGVDSAVNGLQQRLNAFTLPAKWVQENKINIKTQMTQTSDGIMDERAKIFGTYHLNLFLYKNLVVQIAGNSTSTSDALPKWTKDLWNELLNY
ncbi:uncharacterized protein FSUBG_7362 [Fusarium subglutinans]|uniref:Uncharacterized protein n=1 Tax=Gibberella subglutinans TaxID=42677 RepID=A0A8H5UZS0_GIBSU|nr:uncharacterized protein FSUBG_7362 [Fusarium subglutinans]KAF5603139.1 hypothetical protein FSUBG_7362 [Fusarium subglutinans]